MAGISSSSFAGSLFSFLLKVLRWIVSVPEFISTYLARKRDAKLKNYECTLTWKDGGMALMVNGNAKAENEDQARRLVNAEAAKTLPVLKLIGGHHEFIPPYIQDSKAALALWKVVEVPLSDLDRDRVSQGVYGPAAAHIVGFS